MLAAITRDTTVLGRGRSYLGLVCAITAVPVRSSQCAGRELAQVVAAANPPARAGTNEPPDPPIDFGGGMACMPRPSGLYQTRTVVDAIVEAYDVEVTPRRALGYFKKKLGNLKGSS